MTAAIARGRIGKKRNPGVGLLIAGVAVKEGTEAWRGEGCCVSSPLDGAGFAEVACDDDCCHARGAELVADPPQR